MERTFIITYTYPTEYRGTYVVKGNNSWDASNKCREYLETTFGAEEHQSSTVTEVLDNKLIILG